MTWADAITAVISVAVLGGCEPSRSAANPNPSPTPDRLVLPSPWRSGGVALASALASRRSVRAFAARDLDDAELGQLLWAAQGVTDGHRTAPSAGALYPLTLRVVDARGVWRYAPGDHVVIRELAEDRRRQLADATYAQDAIRSAPVTLVLSAELAITAARYGARAERFATLEAGHVAQNVLLTATALGLGAVPVGAFEDEKLRRALNLTGDVTPLYLIPIGASR